MTTYTYEYLDERMLSWNRNNCTAHEFAESFSDYEIDLLIDALSNMEYSTDPDYYPEKCDTDAKCEVIMDYICRTLCEMMVSGWNDGCVKWFNLYDSFARSRFED